MSVPEAKHEPTGIVKYVCLTYIPQTTYVILGLHHQGVFRVSGSQVEINHFKESFERGEDPLAEITDASDVNRYEIGKTMIFSFYCRVVFCYVMLCSNSFWVRF